MPALQREQPRVVGMAAANLTWRKRTPMKKQAWQ